MYWLSSIIILFRWLWIVGDLVYCLLLLVFFRKFIMLLICVLFFLVSQEVLIVCNSRFLCILFRLLLGLVIIDNWLWICFVDWLILVMFVNGLKCRVLLFRYILFMFLYRDLYLFFMLNIMVKFLEFSMLWISGCISLVLLVLEVL